MEEDKKKKKNKKKKNKQANKPTESVALDAKESTSDYQSHVPNIGHDNNGQVSAGATAASSDVERNSETHRDGHLANGTQGENLATVEKQYWLDKEASFQEKIKELQAENVAKIQKEAMLEEKIKQLQEEKDENIQKEVTQDEKIKLLHDEKSASMQKENSLMEKIIELEKEKDALIQKEGSLEQRMEQLEKENDSHLQKEASLESKILQLEGEKDSWLQKEAGLMEKIKNLVDKAAVFNLEGVSLHEKIKQMERERDTWILSEASLQDKIKQLERERDTWIFSEVSLQDKIKQLERERDTWIFSEVSLQENIKQLERERDTRSFSENSTKESIVSLNNENIKLRAQVTELEQSRNSLVNEKQQFIENISNLQLQIKTLESTGFSHPSTVKEVISEEADANHQTEAMGALVENLIKENSQLVQKVNALYAELDHITAKTEDSIPIGSAPGHFTAQSVDVDDSSILQPNLVEPDGDEPARAADSIIEYNKRIPVSASTQSLEDIFMEDRRNEEYMNDKYGSGYAGSSEISEVDEIVQIPLHGNEAMETNLQMATNEENTDVPLTEAPLIGAPFRLISFFARYVSGADLVNNNSRNSG